SSRALFSNSRFRSIGGSFEKFSSWGGIGKRRRGHSGDSKDEQILLRLRHRPSWQRAPPSINVAFYLPQLPADPAFVFLSSAATGRSARPCDRTSSEMCFRLCGDGSVFTTGRRLHFASVRLT